MINALRRASSRRAARWHHLIPPSAILVIYAIIVEQDVGKLLLAGFIPGAVSALIYAHLDCRSSRWSSQKSARLWAVLHGAERFASLPAGLADCLFVVFIIIFFVYNPLPEWVYIGPYQLGGDAWGTPTEGGALGGICRVLHGRLQRHALGPAQGRIAGKQPS